MVRAFAILILAGLATLRAQETDPLGDLFKLENRALMCVPGEPLFSEEFDPKTVSERWWFKGEFALRDGALVRTQVNADKPNQRVFLKDAAFHNVIIEFSFLLDGETTDLRLVTGSGGHYNTIIQIRPKHFQINTAADKEAGIVPSHIGEHSYEFDGGLRFSRMTIEFFGEEIIAHADGIPFDIIYGSHPIIDRERTYFAFQFDRPGAKIGYVQIWKAERQHEHWPKRREMLKRAMAKREPVKRDPDDRYQYGYTNVRSRLTRFDPKYRELVKRHEALKGALHAKYPEVFRTHKELTKSIAATKKKIKAEDSEFKSIETEVHHARRAEDDFVREKFPKLQMLPKHRFRSELGLRRFELEKAGDPKLAELVAETQRRQKALEAKFPAAFASVDSLVEKRNAARKALNADAEFQKANRDVADAWRAIKDYEIKAEPRLVKWDEARKK